MLGKVIMPAEFPDWLHRWSILLSEAFAEFIGYSITYLPPERRRRRGTYMGRASCIRQASRKSHVETDRVRSRPRREVWLQRVHSSINPEQQRPPDSLTLNLCVSRLGPARPREQNVSSWLCFVPPLEAWKSASWTLGTWLTTLFLIFPATG